MDEAEMRAEVELIAELQCLSTAIQNDVNAGAGPTIWKLRRAQIADLRERMRSMRTRHLGGPPAAHLGRQTAGEPTISR